MSAAEDMQEDAAQPSAAEPGADNSRLVKLQEISSNASSYMQMHVVANAKFLKQLQQRRHLFVTQKEKGAWFVVFNPVTALRFIQNVDERLPRFPLHTTLMNHGGVESNDPGKKPLFDWDTVFFLSLERIVNYLETVKFMRDSVKPGEEPNETQKELYNTLTGSYPMLKCMNDNQFGRLMETLQEYDADKKIVVNSLFMAGKHGDHAVGSETYMLEPELVLRNENGHLQYLAFQHYTNQAMTLTAVAYGEEGLEDRYFTALRYLPYSYALAALRLSKIVPPDARLPEHPGMMRLAMTCNTFQCGRCYKTGATLCCPCCKFIRYCNEECRVLHFEQGSARVIREGEIELSEKASFLPHQTLCFMFRSVARMWGQIPSSMSMQTFDEIADRADAAVRSSFAQEQTREEEQVEASQQQQSQ